MSTPPSSAMPYLVGTFGRIRDAAAGPDGTLWLLTNNTDGRGSSTAGDDKLVQLRLDVVAPG